MLGFQMGWSWDNRVLWQGRQWRCKADRAAAGYKPDGTADKRTEPGQSLNKPVLFPTGEKLQNGCGEERDGSAG